MNKKINFGTRVACACLLVFGFFVLKAAAVETKKMQMNYKFVNGLWFDGKTFKPRTAYSINGKLTFKYKGATDSTVDLKQNFIVPPFAEAHTHQFWDIWNYKAQVNEFIKQGVFYAKNPHSVTRYTQLVRPFINTPTSVDVSFAGGGLTATDGHPAQLFNTLVKNGMFPGLSLAEAPDQAYFIIDDENDLISKWQLIKKDNPDFIKTYLEHSEEYELRKNDAAYLGKKGLNPKLLPKIVKMAHNEGRRVSVHISTGQDFRNAVAAGVDEVSHLPLDKITESDAKMAAKKGIFVVTTTLSHRDTAHVKDINEVHRHNLKLLYESGVKLAFGTDNMPATAVSEAENIQKLNVFDNFTLLKILTETTPQTIFPNRKIGFLKEDFEANFLALEANPIEDFSSVRKINFRFKQGYEVESDATTNKK